LTEPTKAGGITVSEQEAVMAIDQDKRPAITAVYSPARRKGADPH